MRVLLVTTKYHHPPYNGTSVRLYNIFKNMHSDINIELLTFGDDMLSDRKELLLKELGPSFKNIHIIPSSTLRRIELERIYAKMLNIIKPYTTTMGEGYYSYIMAEIIKKYIDSSEYDLIYISELSLYVYVENGTCKTPYIVDVQDAPSVLMRSYLQAEKSIIKKCKILLNFIWAINYEKYHLSKIANMIFVTPIDADEVRRRCPKSSIWIVPQGVDTEYFRQKNNSVPVEQNLIFTGVMDYMPNHQAMMYFIKDVLPILKRYRPNISLTIVGRYPQPELKALVAKDEGIYITGYVEDIRPYFDQAVVYICPLISGAGIKNKILEAWAMSKPVVATSISCAGLDTKDGENILIADNSLMFAEKILLLLSNENMRSDLSKQGRKCAEECYSWESKANMIANICREVTSKSNRES